MVEGFRAANARRGIPAWKARSASARVLNDLKRAPANFRPALASSPTPKKRRSVCLPIPRRTSGPRSQLPVRFHIPAASDWRKRRSLRSHPTVLPADLGKVQRHFFQQRCVRRALGKRLELEWRLNTGRRTLTGMRHDDVFECDDGEIKWGAAGTPERETRACDMEAGCTCQRDGD